MQYAASTDFSFTALRQHPDAAAVLVLLLGLALAFGLSRGLGRLYGILSRRDIQVGARSVELHTIASQQTARRVTFWVVTLLSMLLALRLLSADALGDWRASLVDYGSRALMVLIILLLGTSVSTLARDLLLGLSESREAAVLARSVQVLILIFAFAAAFDQLGLDVFLFSVVFATLAAVIVGAMALAFALGSRDYVANLVARSELQRISIGDRIRINELEGVVSQVHKLGIDLVTAEGTMTIPAQWLISQPYLKLRLDSDA